jgi:quercetin dioxygenase-like cupin family protein
MVYRNLLTLAFGAAMILCLSVVLAAQVAMHQEAHHHLVFENEFLRILEPRIDPGDTTLDHTHSHDTASVCISGSTMRNRVVGAEWGQPVVPCSPGRVTLQEDAGRPTSHRAENVGSSPFRLVTIENLKDAGWSSAEAVAAPFTKTIQDGRAFRVYGVNLRSAGSETHHVHRQPTVAILVSGLLIVSQPNANQPARLDQPGQWRYFSAGDAHTFKAEGAADTVAVEVEIL